MRDDISKARAKKAQDKGDSKLWTPRDALLDTLNEIDSNHRNIKQIAIHYLWESEDGRKHGYACADLSREEHIALLALAQANAIEDWRV